jgi:hypothetical protein
MKGGGSDRIITLTVTIVTDGDVDWLAKATAEYLTEAEYPYLTDYSREATGGYEGPFVRKISVKIEGNSSTYSYEEPVNEAKEED